MRVVDTTICRMRRKLERDPSAPANLITESDGCYVLRQSRPDAPAQVFGRSALVDTLLWLLEDGDVVLRGVPGMGRTTVAREVARRFGGWTAWGATEVKKGGLAIDDPPDGPVTFRTVRTGPTRVVFLQPLGFADGWRSPAARLMATVAGWRARSDCPLSDGELQLRLDACGGHPQLLLDAGFGMDTAATCARICSVLSPTQRETARVLATLPAAPPWLTADTLPPFFAKAPWPGLVRSFLADEVDDEMRAAIARRLWRGRDSLDASLLEWSLHQLAGEPRIDVIICRLRQIRREGPLLAASDLWDRFGTDIAVSPRFAEVVLVASLPLSQVGDRRHLALLQRARELAGTDRSLLGGLLLRLARTGDTDGADRLRWANEAEAVGIELGDAALALRARLTARVIEVQQVGIHDVPLGEAHISSLLGDAFRTGDGEVIAEVHATIGVMAIGQGALLRAESQLADALHHYEEIALLEPQARVLCNLGYVLGLRGRVRRAISHLVRAHDIARKLGSLETEAMSSTLLARYHWLAGTDATVVWEDRALRLLGWLPADVRVALWSVRAMAACGRGEMRVVSEAIEQAREQGVGSGWLVLAETLRHLDSADADTLVALDKVIASCDQRPMSSDERLVAVVLRTRLATRLGLHEPPESLRLELLSIGFEPSSWVMTTLED